MKCSVFQDFSRNIGEVELSEIAKDIRSGKYSQQILEIRLAQSQNDAEEKSKLKSKLQAFTPSAIFDRKRLKEEIVKYTKIVHLDFDKISREILDISLRKIREIPETLMSFVSPSGNGIKVFIRVDSDLVQHNIAYHQVKEYYESKLNILADAACKDVVRLCFVSYDPDLYYNEESRCFHIITSNDLVSEIEDIGSNSTELSEILEKLWLLSYQRFENVAGNRNNLAHYFACNCNRKGLSKYEVKHFIRSKCNLTYSEIDNTVEGVYKRNIYEFAKFTDSVNLQNTEQQTPHEDYLKTTPTIPEELYFQLPEILQHGAMAFTDERERDVFLTGAISILSGCLPGVKGVYAGNEVFPNLFSFVIAPAASGKGALKYAKMLADDYHIFILKSSREDELKYNQELLEFKQRVLNRKKGDTTTEEPPVKPKFKVVFIPANTSNSKILWHLEQNEGYGIICETEADTLGNVFKQEWGSYSDMLRKSFHGEKLSSSRKLNNEFIEVDSPKLSIALSGTPNQVIGLIPSSEDGLFSRFLFYIFTVKQHWKDVSPDGNKINMTEHFKLLSSKVFRLVKYLENEETIIDLSSDQWRTLNHQCEKWLDDVILFTAEEAASIVKRLGLILYRISMIFTSLRKYENGESATRIVCSDVDFYTSLRLAEIYLQHSILLFSNLPKQSDAIQFKASKNKSNFYEALPDNFTRQDAVRIGSKFNMSIRSVDGFLNSANEKYLEKIKTGYYRKL